MAGPIRTHNVFPPNSANFRRDRVGNPQAGSCTLCRSSKASTERPCVSLGPNAQPFREGMVVVCFNCANAIGAAVGMLSAKDREELSGAIDSLKVLVEQQAAELVAFGALREALDTVAAK